MKFPIYQIDAFASQLFCGNPAAIVPLSQWLSDETMQKIAAENNLSETAFIVPISGEPIINTSTDPLVINNLVSETAPEYEIRWFTPVLEINLCGHATLAAAFVLFKVLDHPANFIIFHSKSGELLVEKIEDSISLNFPSWMPAPVGAPQYLSEALGGVVIVETHQNRDLMVVLENELAVINCQPDFALIKQYFDKIIITAPGGSENIDFVSRFFAPAAGVDEDPVTGSAHSQLIPFWSKKLGKLKMTARQLSTRGGTLLCEALENRVLMGGNGVLYLKGEIFL